MRKCCKDCDAFAPLTRQCRRHAPVMVPVPQANAAGQQVGVAAMGLYPATTDDGWCLEFEQGVAVVVN